MKLENATRWLCAAIVIATCCSAASAQYDGVQRAGTHPLLRGNMPPGAIGAIQTASGGPRAGHLQPIEFRGPPGLFVGIAANGGFTDQYSAPMSAALEVGPVFRLRVTGLPGREEAVVYPTLEIIDRVYPPAGQENEFPIPVELTRDDLELAFSGNFITRVIYVEDPETALPVAEQDGSPRWHDAGPGADPYLQAADLGRPVAILRMGGRQPVDPFNPEPEFLGHGGQLQLLDCEPAELTPVEPAGSEPTPVTIRTAALQTIPIWRGRSEKDPRRGQPEVRVEQSRPITMSGYQPPTIYRR